jgi:hypothetical protein
MQTETVRVPAGNEASAARTPAILSLIGNTPLVEITRFNTGLCKLFVKLENHWFEFRTAAVRFVILSVAP